MFLMSFMMVGKYYMIDKWENEGANTRISG